MFALAMGRLSNRKGPVGRSSLLAVELAPRHSFYDRCNEILAEAEFDETVEMLCQPYYEDGGRLSIPRAGTSACCSSASSRAWSRSARSSGAVPTRYRCTAFCGWSRANACPTGLPSDWGCNGGW